MKNNMAYVAALHVAIDTSRSPVVCRRHGDGVPPENNLIGKRHVMSWHRPSMDIRLPQLLR